MGWETVLRSFVGVGLLSLYLFWWFLARRQKLPEPKRRRLSSFFLALWERLTLSVVVVLLFQILGYEPWPINLPSPFLEGLAKLSGLMVFVLGGALAVWGRISLGRNWVDDVGLREEHRLVTSGAYRYSRHPIYLGLVVSFLGVELFFRSWFLLLCVPIILAFLYLARREEAALKRRFGKEYLDYKERVGWIFKKR